MLFASQTAGYFYDIVYMTLDRRSIGAADLGAESEVKPVETAPGDLWS